MKFEGFSRQILAKYSVSDLMKSVQGEPSCSMRTDGRTEKKKTDMTKLIVVFRSFAKAHKNRSREHVF